MKKMNERKTQVDRYREQIGACQKWEAGFGQNE